MPPFRAFLALVFAVLAGLPARAELPPGALAATEQAMATCREGGGRPAILPEYETVADLNGDGVPDHLTNLMGLQCEGAWSLFCGSAGCPVTVWLSQPDGSHAGFDFGHLQAVEIAPAAAGAPPAVRAFYHGAFCGEGRPGVEGCARVWTFPAGAAPVEQPEPEAAAPAPEPAAPAPVPPGWTLREVPGNPPLALGGGTGEILWFAGFCLQGQPFLSLLFDPARTAPALTLRFDFSEGPVEARALLEPTAGGAHVIALAGTDLAARLAGRDSSVAVAVDGVGAGALSLAGSTRALRRALGACLPI